MDFLAVSDAFIGKNHFAKAGKLLQASGHSLEIMRWGPSSKAELENIIRDMEQAGPSFNSSMLEIIHRLDGRQGLLVDFCPVPSELVDQVQIIGVCRANTSNVDMKRATALHVPVISVSGRNANAVAEFTVGLMLAESRHIARSHANLMKGVWIKEYGYEPNEMQGKTVGIVGFGTIGRALSIKLEGFGCKVLYYDPFVGAEDTNARQTSLEELLMRSDFVTVHVRLTQKTKNLIGEKQLAMMRSSAYLINTARSEIINQAALIHALKSRQIRGAALDVFTEEPLPPHSPLLKMENVTLTPHMAGATQESLSKSPLLLVQNVLEYLAGDAGRHIQNQSA